MNSCNFPSSHESPEEVPHQSGGKCLSLAISRCPPRLPGVVTLYCEKTLCMVASPVPVTEMPPLCVLTLSVSKPRIGSASESLRAWTLTADNPGLPALTTLRGNFLWQRDKFASVGGLAALADLLGTHTDPSWNKVITGRYRQTLGFPRELQTFRQHMSGKCWSPGPYWGWHALQSRGVW